MEPFGARAFSSSPLSSLLFFHLPPLISFHFISSHLISFLLFSSLFSPHHIISHHHYQPDNSLVVVYQMYAEQLAREFRIPMVRLIDGSSGGGSVAMILDEGDDADEDDGCSF